MKKLFLILIVVCHSYILADTLNIYYEERIPYINVTSNNLLEGCVGEVITNALKKSKVDFKFLLASASKQLIEIEKNHQKVCGIGWFKNKDREKFAKFSEVIYQDKPTVILHRSEDLRFEKISNISDLLSKNDLSVLLKSSYSYGEFLDNELKKSNLIKRTTFEDNQKMTQLIGFNRADFMFASYEEGKLLVQKDKSKRLSIKEIADLPKGNKRYLMCSKMVDDSIIEAINKQLR